MKLTYKKNVDGMVIRKEGRLYGSTLVVYTLYFKDNTLKYIVNEFGNSVEKNSECWEYFKNKYEHS